MTGNLWPHASTFLANSKIPNYIDGQHAIAQDKIMIIDRTTVITGSFNFTKAADKSQKAKTYTSAIFFINSNKGKTGDKGGQAKWVVTTSQCTGV